MKDSRRTVNRLGLPLALLITLLAVTQACDNPIDIPGSPNAPVKEIRIAYDPNKARLFEELVSTYNRQASVKINAAELEIPGMLEAISGGDFVAVSPDSSIWLESFDHAWQSANPDSPPIVGTTVRYASTPVVVATWQGREPELGVEAERGWAALLRRASQDPSYRWSHGSPRASASGMLALVAEFYVGANKTFGLTKADADRENVRRTVAEIEKTISRYGGESDAALVDYLLKEGQSSLSAIVMPEASVFDFNQRTLGAKLLGIHPAEGTLMLDHPLVLLETAKLSPEQRRAFLDFARFVSGPGQAIVVKHGYRPTDLSIDVNTSPLKEEGLAIAQPKLLQMPAPGTLAYLRVAWAYGLKRRANVMLLVDVSGSMQGDKLQRSKEALISFIKQLPSDEERVGLATFSTDYSELVPVGRLGDNRQLILAQVDRLKAEGSTSLFYAIWRAHRRLEELRDTERMNVLVAMTDGLENTSSNFSQRYVGGIGAVPDLTSRGAGDIGPVARALRMNGSRATIFNIAYGSDADLGMLSSLASSFGGRAYRADPDTIRKLYELISQNF